MKASRHSFQNRLLAHLSPADLSLLGRYLRPIDLPIGMVLEHPDEVIAFAYFLESGVASVVAGGKGGSGIALIGVEGMSGVSLLLGADRSTNLAFMRAGGRGFRIRAQDLQRFLVKQPKFQSILLLYVQTFLTQVSQTALCNGQSKIEPRLARWLLMAHDRAPGSLPFTHQVLSLMLGVRRAGVTVALHVLEGYRLIKARRGTIDVLDRPGLAAHAGSIYGTPEVEYERLLTKKSNS